jgi:hypothetical protein
MRRAWIASLIFLIVGILIGVEMPRAFHATRLLYARMKQERRANEIRTALLQQNAAVQTCNTIVQTYADVGVVAYLSADVPVGATDRGAVFCRVAPRSQAP